MYKIVGGIDMDNNLSKQLVTEKLLSNGFHPLG